jgi:maleate cis-trans isomerase
MQHACVVYDATTGEVRHIHQVAVLPGAKGPAKGEVEARAMALAKRFTKHDPSRFKLLHVTPENLKPGMKHKVDLKSLTLISERLLHRW